MFKKKFSDGKLIICKNYTAFKIIQDLDHVQRVIGNLL